MSTSTKYATLVGCSAAVLSLALWRLHKASRKGGQGGSLVVHAPGTIVQLLQNAEEVAAMREDALAYAAVNGIIMSKDAAKHTVVHAPFALLPFEMDAGVFKRAQDMCQLFNLLVDRISRDVPFLVDTLGSVAQSDDFNRRLLAILQRVHAKGEAQPIHLNLNRSDYMINAVKDAQGNILSQTPQQVELNTIAASFGGLSTKITSMHRMLLERRKDPAGYSQALPANDAIGGLAAGIARACELHPHPREEQGVALCVVLPGETNIADQRMLEYALWDNHRVRMIRRTLLDIEAQATLDPATGDLLIDGDTVAVCYFRAGYDPKHYTSDREWAALLMIEESFAIKCPSVACHLAGCKKVQQTVALPGVLERFLGAQEAAMLRTCFAGLWGLEADDDETKRVIADAIAHPENYVLKPQREGGGNNFWGTEMVEKLRTAPLAERSAFILMACIKPNPGLSALVREGVLDVTPCLSELGIFGTFIADDKKVHLNHLCGHLLRTKKVGVEEGGVAAGYAVLSSPFLVSSE